jgi:hypothetical protein
MAWGNLIQPTLIAVSKFPKDKIIEVEDFRKLY